MNKKNWVFGLGAVGLAAAMGMYLGHYGPKVVRHIQMTWVPEPERIEISPQEGEQVIRILGVGQSNATNHGSLRARSGPGVVAFDRGAYFKPIDPWPGGTGLGGSVWSRMGPLVLEAYRVDRVEISSIAVGSSAVKQWAKGGNLNGRLVQGLKDFSVEGREIDWIIWHQGETESYGGAVSTEEYQRDLASVVQSIRAAGCHAAILICQATYHRGSPMNTSIRLAQSSSWDSAQKIYAGMDTDSLGEKYRSDGVHFNSRGLEVMARGLLLAMQRKSDQEAVSLSDIQDE